MRRRTARQLSWGAGDTIHLGKRTLRVIGKRDDDEADEPPVLIVEEVD